MLLLSDCRKTALGLALLGAIGGCSDEPGSSADQVSSSGGTTSAASGGSGSGPSVSTGGFGAGGGGIVLDTGGTSTVGAGGMLAVFDGGQVPLTPDQIEALTDGACASDSEDVVALPPVLQFVVDISLSMDSVAPGNAPLTKWDVTKTALLDSLDALPDSMPVGLLLYPTLDVPTCPIQGPNFGAGGTGANPIPGGGGFGMPGAGSGGLTATPTFPPQQQQLGEGNPGCVGLDGLVPIADLGAPGEAQRTALSASISSTGLYLGTPTHDAYQFALEDSLKLDTSGRRKFMLLITDGAPTQMLGCGPLICDPLVPDGPEATAIIQAIAAAHAEGVDTYIIGSPGSEDGAAPMQGPGADMRPWLSEAAVAGGTASEGCTGEVGNFCHFDMTQAADFGQALADGLSNIAGELEASCDFDLPQRADVDARATDVVIQWSDGTASKSILDEVGDCTEGWRFTGEATMELCPTTCAAFQADHGASVKVSFNCIDTVR